VLSHTKKPDLDKLLRALKDALKGVIYRDDSQVVRVVTSKDYSPAPGVIVTVRQL
jgi:Holliday junction resolvase RusA-like endonuclease